MSLWWPFLFFFKSLHQVSATALWRSGTSRFHIWVDNLQMSCSDLTWQDGTSIIAQAMATRARLNIKTVFPRYGDSHVKDKTVGETVLFLIWGSLYCKDDIFILRWAPGDMPHLKHYFFWQTPLFSYTKSEYAATQIHI